jgi:RNA polymerase sigma factor (sigma-70 family)
MTDSQKLLADYARTGSEEAFRELLSRYIDLVYSSAVRLAGNDADLAKDVTQTVFVALARKAPQLPPDVMLGGWLHHHTVFVAATLLRGERRRQARERQAVEMNALQEHTPNHLEEMAPLLDEAIEELGAEDRRAILLRFFEQRDFPSLGQLLGSTEEAARKRVSRALEKLQLLLKHRGVTLSVAALGTALAAEAVTAAPAGLAASVGATALASAAAGGISLSMVKILTMTKLKFGVLSALLAGGVVAPLVIQHQSLVQVRADNLALRQQLEQMAQLETENGRLSKLIAEAGNQPTPSLSAPAELLRLRGEVGVLRRQLQEAQPPVSARAPGNPASLARSTTAEVSLERQLRSQGRHWVQTTGKVTLGGLVEDRFGSRPDEPEGIGTLGKVISLSNGDNDPQTAVVDFGHGYTRSFKLADLAPVSDVAAADSAEGNLLAQGKQWVPATGEIGVGAWVEDRLDGRHDQPEGRGALGKVLSISPGENQQPVALVDFGRGYTVGLNLSEIAPVSVVPR